MAKNTKKNEEKIIAAMDALDSSSAKMRKLADRYLDYIDEAALRGDDARAKMLIRSRLNILNLGKKLESFKLYLESSAITAKVVSDLGALPAALDGCKGLLAESPDFKKLGKSMAKIAKELNAPAEELDRLNAIFEGSLVSGTASTLESRLDAAAAEENDEAFAAEYAAMMERVKRKVAPDSVVEAADVAADTGNIDIAGIIDDENKKK